MEDPLHLADRLHDRLALLNGEGHRLLHTDILALQTRLHHHPRMPVVLRADHHAVNAGIVQHLAVVHLQFEVIHLMLVIALRHRLHVRQPRRIHVADRGEHGEILIAGDSADVHRRADPAAPDQRDLQLVARRIRAENRGRHNGREKTRRQHTLHEFPSADLSHSNLISSFLP